MINFIKQSSQSVIYAFVASLTIISMLLAMFFIMEPAIGRGQTDGEFRIRQTITGESSFTVLPTNISMSGNIAGSSGGQATGTTQVSVLSNNSAGYYVLMAFDNNGTPEAMIGDVSLNEAIRDYSGDAGGEPSYLRTASTAAQLAYTVYSSTTLDADDSFLSNGTDTCNTGSTGSGGTTCWKAPSTTDFRIIDRSSSSPTGATTTIVFNVTVPSAASPLPVSDTYTATATLTLFDK
jgi:hypothetical protein